MQGTENRVWIGGTARSGTTWLCNLLAIRATEQVFEPLFPRRMEFPASLDPPMLPHRRPYLRPQRRYPSWQRFLESLYSGEHRNHWTRFGNHHRRTWPGLWLRSLFTKRVAIKEIRSNLMLGWIARHLGVKVVYIIRHPCATVQSLRAHSMRLELTPMLDDEALCEDYLYPFADYLRNGISSPLEIQAASWAVENLVPLHQATSAPFLLITYESMLLDPRGTLARAMAHLGWKPTASDWRAIEKRLLQPVSGLDRPMTPEALLGKWRTGMSEAEIDEVLAVCRRLGIDLYSRDLLPDSDMLPAS